MIGGRRGNESRSLALSGGLTIDRFMRAGSSASNDRITVKFAPDGRSPTYAIRVKTDRDDPLSGQKWLVVVGSSGQYVEASEDSVVEEIVQR